MFRIRVCHIISCLIIESHHNRLLINATKIHYLVDCTELHRNCFVYKWSQEIYQHLLPQKVEIYLSQKNLNEPGINYYLLDCKIC